MGDTRNPEKKNNQPRMKMEAIILHTNNSKVLPLWPGKNTHDTYHRSTAKNNIK